MLLIVEAPPVPAGAVEAGRDEQDDHQGDEQAEAQDGGHHGPHQRPLGHVYEGRGQGHAHPARTPAVLRRVPRDVHALHGQAAEHARPLVAELVEGVLPVVAAHAALTCGGEEPHAGCELGLDDNEQSWNLGGQAKKVCDFLLEISTSC